jgi:hypothetical protein
MPHRLAALAALWRAISSRRLSTGCAMAFSCTVVSTITRSSSVGLTSFIATDASMVDLSSCSTPAWPSTRRKRPICVASHGRRGSWYAMPLKSCQTTFSLQRSQSSSSLSLKACFKYSSAIIKRSGRRGGAGVAQAGAGELRGRAEQVGVFDDAANAVLVREQRRQRGFDRGPRHARCKHGQWVAQLDHRVQPGTKKVVGGHRLRSPKLPETDIY